MKLNECIEYLQSSLGGGVFTDEGKNEVGFTEKMLAVGRAFCIREMYRSNTEIPEIFYQTIDLTYDDDLQEDDCYNLFRYPNIVNVNTQLDGHQYLGQYKGDVSWRRVRSTAAWANTQKAIGTRPKKKSVYYLLEPQFETVKVFDKGVKRATGYSIFADPLHELIQFNRQEDEYPISQECLQLMEQYFRNGQFDRFTRTNSDIVSNAISESSLPNNPNQ